MKRMCTKIDLFAEIIWKGLLPEKHPMYLKDKVTLLYLWHYKIPFLNLSEKHTPDISDPSILKTDINGFWNLLSEFPFHLLLSINGYMYLWIQLRVVWVPMYLYTYMYLQMGYIWPIIHTSVFPLGYVYGGVWACMQYRDPSGILSQRGLEHLLCASVLKWWQFWSFKIVWNLTQAGFLSLLILGNYCMSITVTYVDIL